MGRYGPGKNGGEGISGRGNGLSRKLINSVVSAGKLGGNC